jgi:hypothetical protein
MKAKKKILVIMAACSVITLFAVSAHAAKAWYTCTVVQVGPGWGKAYICLSDDGSAFANKWFILKDDQEKEQLATALTAMGNGQKVYVNLDLGGGQYPAINAMYLGEPPTS